MPLEVLQATNLAQLSDGYVGKLVDKNINDVLADIVDRGDDGQTRKVTITLTFKPETKGRYEIDTTVKLSLPAHRPPKTIAKVDMAAGGFTFNPDLADNPEQKTFADIDAAA